MKGATTDRSIQGTKRLSDLRFDNTFARLPNAFHSRVPPTPLEGTQLISVSPAAASLLDLLPQSLHEDQAMAWLGGIAPLSQADPIAMCYAGHQFGQFVPQLGDGRAIILGEVVTDQGHRWELQLKGAGLTPYSRDGDGRAVLRSTIREYLCSEAMHALDIPTTRALCMFGSDEAVYRETIERGALLVRMAPSHVRFGSFEVLFYRQQFDQLRRLADYVIDHDYPQLRDEAQPYLALLHEVVLHTAELIGRWQLIGFAHGVTNSDNMSILGLTLDYGPFGFMDTYDPGFICTHSDYQGRYAFERQPAIGLWNLTCLAQAMLPLLDADNGEAAVELAREALAAYEPAFSEAHIRGMRAKLGLQDAHEADHELSTRLLDLMGANRVGYTNFFRDLADLKLADPATDGPLRDRFIDRAGFDAWTADYRARLRSEQRPDRQRRAAMNSVNPRYVLRNYLAQQAIEAAEQGDFSEIERLLALLSRPFEEQPGMEAYAQEPPDWAGELAVSCSS
ncbi:MAG: YdiU family protein [Sedimenticolaceae bacterium]